MSSEITLAVFEAEAGRIAMTRTATRTPRAAFTATTTATMIRTMTKVYELP
jgi:hypothetical protein